MADHPELLDWLAVPIPRGDATHSCRNGEVRSSGRSLGRQGAGPPDGDLRGVPAVRRRIASQAGAGPVQPADLPGTAAPTRCGFIRDNALSIAGLLSDRIGGPSVKPYQPAGIWDGTDSVYAGPRKLLYRRDCTSSGGARRIILRWQAATRRTARCAPSPASALQTPLQSLVLMNDQDLSKRPADSRNA